MNEYYSAEKLDATSLPILQQQIWDLIQEAQLTADLDLRGMLSRDHGDHKHEWDDELTPDGVPVTLAEMSGSDVAHLIEDIDGYLCELGTAQIRDGLHVLGSRASIAGHVARADTAPEWPCRKSAGGVGVGGRIRPSCPSRSAGASPRCGARRVGHVLREPCRPDRAVRGRGARALR